MRIITGTLGGRKLISPKTNDIRPTSDKVKEAIFSMLLPYMEEGFVAIDLFSGTGNMGLEAISRGAKTVYFSDASRDSLSLTKQNVKLCGVEDNAVLLAGDFRQNLRRIRQKADIIFLDPPYADGYILPSLQIIDDADLLKEGGVVVCEHSHKEKLPEEIYGFTAVRDRRYGAIGVTIYERKKDDA